VSGSARLGGVTADGTPELSVVIPFFNEEAAVGELLAELRQVLERIGSRWEVLAIDDASTDATPRILAALARQDERIRVLRWEDNQGQAAALYRGLRAARAPLVATLDGDGQNDPADLPALLGALGSLDMIVGVRAARHDSRLRLWMSRLANRVRGRVLGDRLRDSGCALKVFRREVVEALLPIRTLYSFMPAMALAAGFRIGEQEVNHRPRRGGVSSYGLRQFLWRPLVDMAGMWWFSRRRFPPPPDDRDGGDVRARASQSSQRTPNEGSRPPQVSGLESALGVPPASALKRKSS